jgi:hypothetical protein
MSEPTVVDAPERSRFEISADGTPAGFAAYLLRGEVITFTHTGIDDAVEGRGLGGRLVRAALDEARARGLAVRPACPFVRAWIAKHPGYLDLVPEPDRPRYDLA